MKNVINTQASTSYTELLAGGTALPESHPAVQQMLDLSDQVSGSSPTAIDRIEVYKECHRLADDLYRMTGNKRLHSHVIRIGDLLLSRVFNKKPRSVNGN